MQQKKHLKQKSKQTKLRQVKKPLRLRENCRKEVILEKLTGLVGAAADATRNEVEALKQAYYKIHRSEVDELKKAFLTAGGGEKDFVAPEDETESKIKELLNVYKEKRAAILAEEERVKAANYA